MENHIKVEEVSWKTHSSSIKRIRQEVFIHEQDVPESEEWDDYDTNESTQHLLAFDTQGNACATLRLVTGEDKHFKITRLAVLSHLRNRGIANALLRFACQTALENDAERIHLYAQTNAIKIYEKFGFFCIGEQFLDAGIEHIEMEFNKSNADGYERIYSNQVLRLNYPNDFLRHTINITRSGRRQLDICSKNLRDDIFARDDFIRALSSFARSDRRAKVRILVHSSKNLNRRTQSLIELTRRLSSKIQLKTLSPGCEDAPQGFVCSDAKRLVFFNNEDQLDGFCCYQAGPESKSILDDFEHAWHHLSQEDPNLSVLNI